MTTRVVVPVLLLFVSLSIVQATPVTFLVGNIAQSGDENILFGHASCLGCVDGPSPTVIGHGQGSNILVDFANFDSPLVNLQTSGSNTVTCDVCSTTVGFNNVSVFAPGYYFTTIILNLTEISAAPDGLVTFTAHTNAGDFSSGAVTDHTGGTFYTITTDAATRINSLDFSNNFALHDFSQVRMTLSPVPEPATYVLSGLALVGIALIRRTR